jgi:hypothetical protein
VLPAAALGPVAEEWAGLRQIARVYRSRQLKKNGAWQPPEIEIAYLITSLSGAAASPQALLTYNREHWGIENRLHRDKDMTLGEDAATNRKGHAPRNIASFNNLTLTILRSVNPSPRRALEHFQDDKNRAISMLCSTH